MLFHPQFALFFLLVCSLSAPRVQASYLSAIYPSYLSAEGYLVGRPFPVLTAGFWPPVPTPSHEQRSCPGFSGARFHLAPGHGAGGGCWQPEVPPVTGRGWQCPCCLPSSCPAPGGQPQRPQHSGEEKEMVPVQSSRPPSAMGGWVSLLPFQRPCLGL